MGMNDCFSFGLMLMVPAVLRLCPPAACSVPEESQCDNLPPGIQKALLGVDMTKLDLVPLDLMGSSGFKSTVLQFTCKEKGRWKSAKGVEYQLPDQVSQITPLPGGWLSAEVEVYKNYNDVRKMMTRKVGGEGTLWKFSFSSSLSYQKMQQTLVSDSAYISDTSSFESATRMNFKPSWDLGLNPSAETYVQRLTGTFKSNPGGYMKFIREFGTHYLSSANFGGFIRVISQTKVSYLSRKSESEIEANAKLMFMNVVSVDGAAKSSNSRLDTHFTNVTTQTALYYGGDTNLLKENSISQWQPTVFNNPWLFSGELKPISDLITDEAKRASMEEAVEQYVLGSYMEELDRLISVAGVKSASVELGVLRKKMEDARRNNTLSEAAVEEMGKVVEENVVVPAWFTEKTTLCFKWWAEGDERQCGGGVDYLLCAAPNSMTAPYKDDTDDRDRGCMMQWGIKSHAHPEWFGRVQICYQWYPDQDARQCGGHEERLLCASVNEFTRPYRDDSDGRRGGCQMAWMLKVPGDAPLWMKTARVCFHWFPEGHSDQCVSHARDYCAAANEWTVVYNDNTDNRHGGCRLSWGLKVVF